MTIVTFSPRTRRDHSIYMHNTSRGSGGFDSLVGVGYYTARATLIDDQGTYSTEIWNALRKVIDPEIGLDIVTLGLVYEIDVTMAPDVVGNRVRVTHTLTTPGCPMEGIITAGIRSAVGRVDGVGAVETNLVWDPMWHSGMIAPGAW